MLRFFSWRHMDHVKHGFIAKLNHFNHLRSIHRVQQCKTSRFLNNVWVTNQVAGLPDIIFSWLLVRVVSWILFSFKTVQKKIPSLVFYKNYICSLFWSDPRLSTVSFAIPSTPIQNNLSVYLTSNYLPMFFHPAEDTFLSAIINYTNSSTVHFKLSPTYVLYMACRYILSPTYCPDMSPSERTHKVIAIVNKMVSMMEGVIQVSNTLFPILVCVDFHIEHNVIDCFLSQCVRLPLVWLRSFIMLLFHTDILLVKCLNCVLFNSPCSLYSYTRLHL